MDKHGCSIKRIREVNGLKFKKSHRLLDRKEERLGEVDVDDDDEEEEEGEQVNVRFIPL